jgi:tetratricopeptide (TPR) repeat protein
VAAGGAGRRSESGPDALVRAARERGIPVVGVTDAEAMQVAMALAGEQAEAGHTAAAEATFRQAMASGEAEVAGSAAFNLGILLEQRGDLDGAADAYRSAVARADTPTAAKAALNLGNMAAAGGDLETAATLLRRAMDDGEEAEVMPRAATGLGWVLARQGHSEKALATWKRAIESRNVYESRSALLQTGAHLAQWGRTDEALAAFSLQVKLGHPEFAPKAQACIIELVRKGQAQT